MVYVEKRGIKKELIIYFAISNALKKRFVFVFQDIFRDHPIWNKVSVITKFPEEERPKYALLIRSASGNSLKLSLDNFIRTNYAFSGLANLKGINGKSIEWVRDDHNNMDKLSAPGFYVVKITADISTDEKEQYNFVVDPFLVVNDEPLTLEDHVSGKKTVVLKQLPVNPDSEVIHIDGGDELKRNINYVIDYDSGRIIFNDDTNDYGNVSCDYQVIGAELGPFVIEPYSLNNDAVPGVIIAFGDGIKVNDEQVVFVEKEEKPTAKVFGGRWNMTISLIAVSLDSDQQERLSDYAVSMFWAEWQDKLVNEGILIHDFTLSEAEEEEMDLPSEYNYTGGIDFNVDTDWELHVPLISELRRINPYYGNESFKQTQSDLKEALYEKEQFDIRMVNAKNNQFGIQMLMPSDSAVMLPSNPYKQFDRKTEVYPRTA
jgi:hypothetical protein